MQHIDFTAVDSQSDVGFDIVQCSIGTGVDEYIAHASGLAVVFRL